MYNIHDERDGSLSFEKNTNLRTRIQKIAQASSQELNIVKLLYSDSKRQISDEGSIFLECEGHVHYEPSHPASPCRLGLVLGHQNRFVSGYLASMPLAST